MIWSVPTSRLELLKKALSTSIVGEEYLCWCASWILVFCILPQLAQHIRKADLSQLGVLLKAHGKPIF